MTDKGQTARGVSVVPNGPAYDRSGDMGRGDEVLRQQLGSSQVTTSYPSAVSTSSNDKGSPGPENKGNTAHGYPAMGGGTPAKVHDATKTGGRSRVKHIEGD